MGRTRAFTPRKVGVLEGWGKGGAGPYSGAHRLPLVAAAGRTDCRWPGQEPGTRVEASELVQIGNDGGWTRWNQNDHSLGLTAWGVPADPEKGQLG